MDDQPNKNTKSHELDDSVLEDISGGTWATMMDQTSGEDDILFDNADVTFKSNTVYTPKG